MATQIYQVLGKCYLIWKGIFADVCKLRIFLIFLLGYIYCIEGIHCDNSK
jgi:hypothetical protein